MLKYGEKIIHSQFDSEVAELEKDISDYIEAKTLLRKAQETNAKLQNVITAMMVLLNAMGFILLIFIDKYVENMGG